MQVIETAVKEGRGVLSEYESKLLLGHYGIPITREIAVAKAADLSVAAAEIGYPLVLKGCSSKISHKTEMNLIRLDVRSEAEAQASFEEIFRDMADPEGSVLVQQMIKGKRELMAGLTRDPQFGPCVMFGLGGIFTEILHDVSFRIAPLEKRDALEMMEEIRGKKILEAVRGMDAVDKDQLCEVLMAVGRIGLENDQVAEIDINPLIIEGSKCVAVDALVVLTSAKKQEAA